MALDLKIKLQPDIKGEVIWVLDNTGAYDADSKTGGWGDPNAELQESCLAIYATRVQDGDDHVVNIITNQFIYDNAAANTDIKEFQLTYDKDGHYVITMFMFQVTTDGVNFVEGGAIQEGDYVYYNNALKKMESSVLVDFSDLASLIDDENVVQETCEELFVAKAKILYAQKRKVYAQKRKENCEDLDPYRDELFDMEQDIIGAVYNFQSNQKTLARQGIDEVHQEYEV